MFKIFDEFNIPQKIISVDLNLCFDLDLNKRSTTYNNYKAVEIIKDYMEENYMVDVWRNRNDDEFCFTWKSNNPLIITGVLS